MNKKISALIVASITTLMILTSCTGGINNKNNINDMLTGVIPNKIEEMPESLYDRYVNDIKAARESIEKNEDQFNAYMVLASAYMNLGEKEKALSGYDQATKLGKNSGSAWINKGIILEDMGQYKEAIKNYESAIENDGILPQAFFRIGVIMNQNLNYSDKKIREFYDNAIQITGYNVEVVFQYIKYLYYDAKDEPAAMKVLDQAIEKNPTNDGLKDMKANGLKASL